MISIAKAKARFAELIRLAEKGQSVVLTRHGRPVAQLAPIEGGSEQSLAPSNSAASNSGGELREPVSPYNAGHLRQAAPLAPESRREALERLLEESIWPRIPAQQLGAGPDKAEREEILGYGSGAV